MAEKITKELVYKLADQITLSGRQVTNQAVRDENDKSGSLSSIGPFLKQWKEENAAVTAGDVPAMPEEMLIAALKPVWALLSRKAQALFNAERDEFKLQLVEQADELAQLSAEVDRQAAENEELKALNVELTAANQQLEIKSAEQATEIKNNEAAIKRAAALYDDLNDELAAEHEAKQAIKTELAVSSTECGKLSRQKSELEDKIDELNGTITNNTYDIKLLKEKNEQLTDDNLDAFGKVNALEKSVMQLKEDKQRLSLEISELTIADKYAKERQQQLSDQIAELNVEKSRLEMANTKLQDALIDNSKVDSEKEDK